VVCPPLLSSEAPRLNRDMGSKDVDFTYQFGPGAHPKCKEMILCSLE